MLDLQRDEHLGEKGSKHVPPTTDTYLLHLSPLGSTNISHVHGHFHSTVWHPSFSLSPTCVNHLEAPYLEGTK